MTLEIPKYIIDANIQDPNIRYLWDDYGDQLEVENDQKLVARLDSITQRAVLALMCGMSEWLIYRYKKLLAEYDIVSSYVESAWVMIIDICYSENTWEEYENDKWSGPIKMPIAQGLSFLEVAIVNVAYQEDDPADDAASLYMLTRYILGDSSLFDEWFNRVLERLELLYPRDFDEDPGDVIPREALDPSHDVNIENAETMINQFLSKLDSKNNYFLKTSDDILHSKDMEDTPFIGIPYVYNLDIDRENR